MSKSKKKRLPPRDPKTGRFVRKDAAASAVDEGSVQTKRALISDGPVDDQRESAPSIETEPRAAPAATGPSSAAEDMPLSGTGRVEPPPHRLIEAPPDGERLREAVMEALGEEAPPEEPPTPVGGMKKRRGMSAEEKAEWLRQQAEYFAQVITRAEDALLTGWLDAPLSPLEEGMLRGAWERFILDHPDFLPDDPSKLGLIIAHSAVVMSRLPRIKERLCHRRVLMTPPPRPREGT